jgi:biotin carboxylase
VIPSGPDQHLLLVNFTEFYALPVLRAAHQRGIRVTALGPDEAFGRHPEVGIQADARIVADLGRDGRSRLLERVSTAHRSDPFTGVFVSREDAVEVAAELAAHLGLEWNKPGAVQNIRNKWHTRRILATRDFRQPAHHLCRSVDDVQSLLRASPGSAWILKPLQGTASRGIVRVVSADEVERAVAHVLASDTEDPNDGPFLAEHAIEPAREYSVEGVWFGEQPHVLAVTEKETTGPPHFVETGHTLPAALAPSLEQSIRETACAGLRTLGASHGLFHVEVFVDGEGVIFGEAHVRAGGDRITQLLELVGIDVYGLALDGMFGAPPAAFAPHGVAAVRYFCFPSGVLESVDGIDALKNAADVVYWRLDLQPGHRIDPPLHSLTRHGCFVLVGDDYFATVGRASGLRAAVRAHLVPDGIAAV